jgi:hypothetical protein
MPRLFFPGLLILPLLWAGCIWDQPKTATVCDNPFGRTFSGQNPPQVSQPKASIEIAARVDRVGRQITLANVQAGLQPLFRTIGAPQPEAFHKGTAEVDVTEGLVRQCATDGQLAAVLCQELGKMVVEREALVPAEARQPAPLPPLDVAVGNDNGFLGPADQVHRAELAKFEASHPRRQPRTLPDPEVLARAFLVKAGFPATDLDAVGPLLRSAEGNQTLARQITAAPGPALGQVQPVPQSPTATH